MILNRTYGVGAIKSIDSRLAIYPDRLLNNRSLFRQIIGGYIQGLHLIGGFRGSGKTTFLNLFKDEFKDEKFFLHLNILDESYDLISEIVILLDKIIEEEKLDVCDECRSKITELKYNILNEVLIKKSSESRYSEKEVNKLQQVLGITISKVFNINSNNNLIAEKLKKNEIIHEIISTPIQKQDRNIKELNSVLKILSEKKQLVIILDEIDKLSEISFNNFLQKYKELFLESGLIYFIVCDTEKFIKIRQEDKDSNIFNKYIYFPLLSWKEYLITAPKIKGFIDMDTIKKSYLYTMGNFRRIITFDENDKFNLYSRNMWNILNEIENSEIFINLSEAFQDIIKEFLRYFLPKLKLNLYLKDEEILNISAKFLPDLDIGITINRILELLKESKYISYEEGKYEIIRDNVSLYNENLSLKQVLLEDHNSKNFFIRSSNRYSIEYLDTSDNKKLYELIVLFRNLIDGALIFKQESTHDFINNISYHLVLLTRHVFEPTAFVNVKGFSWNHERIRAYAEMKSYLKECNIIYKEYNLKKDERVEHAFRMNQKKYIYELSKVSW